MNPGPSRYQVYMLPTELSWLEYFTFKLNFLTLFFSEMFGHGPSRSFWLPKTVGPFILQRFQKNCKSQICDANTTKGILRFTIEVNVVFWRFIVLLNTYLQNLMHFILFKHGVFEWEFWIEKESARNEKDNKFWVKSEKFSKINPEGTHSPSEAGSCTIGRVLTLAILLKKKICQYCTLNYYIDAKVIVLILSDLNKLILKTD